MTPQQRLLIIDDDESYRQTLARVLTRKGFEVSLAGTPEAALAVCASSVPDFVVLDLNLGGQSGLGLIQPLLAHNPQVRILLLTGYASIKTAVSALRLGAIHYLPKPASTTDILNALMTDDFEATNHPVDEKLSVQHMAWEYIQQTLAEHGGNISATARALNMHRKTLQRKLAKKPPTGFAGPASST